MRPSGTDHFLAPAWAALALSLHPEGPSAPTPPGADITHCLQLFPFSTNFSALCGNDNICYGEVLLLLFCFMRHGIAT